MESSTANGFDQITHRLATFITTTSFSDIPSAVIETEKRHLLDTLGCILYGSTTPWMQKVRSGILTSEPPGPATIIGHPATVSPARAALLNGMASHSMDYDDTCRPGVHAGSATLPTALAFLATTDQTVSGQTFLAALTIGVETGIRTGYALGDCVERGFHIAGWTGAFAASATLASLLDLTTIESGHALAIAGTQGSGLMGAQYGAEVKRYHMGRAAESGYLAGIFASESLTGDPQIFGDRYGSIGPTLSGNLGYNTEAILGNLGKTYRLPASLWFKPFPSIITVHAPIAGVQQLVETKDLDTSEIEQVTVKTTAATKDHVGWSYEPTGVMAAQGNIQYGIASYLLDNELSVAAYTPDAISRPSVLRRVTDIEVVVDEELEDTATRWGATVDIITRSGKQLSTTIHNPPGSPDNPLSENQLIEKFRQQASTILTDPQCDHLIDIVLSLETYDDCHELVTALSTYSEEQNL